MRSRLMDKIQRDAQRGRLATVQAAKEIRQTVVKQTFVFPDAVLELACGHTRRILVRGYETFQQARCPACEREVQP
jgi:hypothetical protein